MTGTQRHILELIKALAGTGALRLRVLIDPETSVETLAQLRSLEGVQLLAADEIGPQTSRSTIFHRPQQVFESRICASRFGWASGRSSTNST